jgi:hypothetical protein
MRRWLAVGGVLTAVVWAGCSQSPTLKVTGTVTIKGEPAENVQVTFLPKEGRPAAGVTDAQGRFELSTFKPGDGAMPGEQTVTLGEYYPPGKPPPMPRGNEPLPSRFPPNYSDTVSSPLKATVERGQKNDFQFDVKK